MKRRILIIGSGIDTAVGFAQARAAMKANGIEVTVADTDSLDKPWQKLGETMADAGDAIKSLSGCMEKLRLQNPTPIERKPSKFIDKPRNNWKK